MSLRQYFADRLTKDVLFYQVVTAPSMPDVQCDSLFVLAEAASSIDGFDEGCSGSRSPTSDSVSRYLEEWYPTKAEFKAHLRSYVDSLRSSPCNQPAFNPTGECTGAFSAHASAPNQLDPKNTFADLQRIAVQIVRHFDRWRFYRAVGADDRGLGAGIGMVVMRCDATAHESVPCGCENCAAMISHDSHAGRDTIALLHFWNSGLSLRPNPRDIRCPESAVQIVKKVGEGHPSEVYEARTSDGDIVAAKRLKDWKKTAGGSLTSERDWLLSFDHPNILPYLGAVVGADGSLLYLLTEFMKLGRLSDVCRNGPVAPSLVIRYGIDIANGLHAMHSVGIMHRDLHSDNILVTTDRAVVADLGSAKRATAGVRHTESLIHYKYIKPPEVCAKSTDPANLGAVYGTPFDIWAMACMLIGMTLGIPCIEMRPESNRPADLTAACAAIPPITGSLQAMLSADADARPSAGKIVMVLKDILKKM